MPIAALKIWALVDLTTKWEAASSQPPKGTSFLGNTQRSIPNCIWIGWAMFAPLTTEFLYFTMGHHFSPLKFYLLIGEAEPPSNAWFCGVVPPESTSQMACRSVESFLHGSRLWQTDRLSLLCCVCNSSINAVVDNMQVSIVIDWLKNAYWCPQNSGLAHTINIPVLHLHWVAPS